MSAAAILVSALAEGAATPQASHTAMAGSKDTSGASQPAPYTSLRHLNKSSGKLATFLVRLCQGRLEAYSYRSRYDNREMTAHKFEMWLVGEDANDYCIGYLKGSEAECKKATIC